MLHFAVPLSAGIGALFQFSFDFGIYRQVFLVADGMLILHCAQGKDPLTVHAGKRRNRRLCAGCEEQFVIGFRVDLSTIQCVNGDGFLCGIDRSYFLP